MTDTPLPRLGAACGAVFAVVLFVAAGDGSGDFLAPRAIAGLVALALFLPFVAYLASVLRAAEGADGWLPRTVQTAGVAGITLKVVSVLPALALHRAGVADGTATHRVLDAFGDGATVIALFPLAVCCAAVALSALRTGALPRWLGWGSAVTAAALAANGCFLEASFVPGLLLFVAWSLVTSIHLVRRAGSAGARVALAEAAAGI